MAHYYGLMFLLASVFGFSVGFAYGISEAERMTNPNRYGHVLEHR